MIDNLYFKTVLWGRGHGSDISLACWDNITVNRMHISCVKEKLKYLQENKTLEFTPNKHRLHIYPVYLQLQLHLSHCQPDMCLIIHCVMGPHTLSFNKINSPVYMVQDISGWPWLSTYLSKLGLARDPRPFVLHFWFLISAKSMPWHSTPFRAQAHTVLLIFARLLWLFSPLTWIQRPAQSWQGSLPLL